MVKQPATSWMTNCAASNRDEAQVRQILHEILFAVIDDWKKCLYSIQPPVTPLPRRPNPRRPDSNSNRCNIRHRPRPSPPTPTPRRLPPPSSSPSATYPKAKQQDKHSSPTHPSALPPVVEVMKLDAEDYISVKTFAQTLKSKHTRLHIAMLTAGVPGLRRHVAVTGARGGRAGELSLECASYAGAASAIGGYGARDGEGWTTLLDGESGDWEERAWRGRRV
ncbi:hypothetical protein CSAL01_12531 [Colletotrichum salicis]|uniref:Uncharacterized protein n=1 Tax=Colletotrichum salicis TaxID=1209931 RepID=A0A135SE54_9PEZI|nr:hypothetical protein CSAL01_12531 [Colletotrichum salicis]